MGVDSVDAGAFGQHAHEVDDVGLHRLARERILRHQSHDLAPFADHDLGIEGKHARELGAELRAGDRPPDHEGPRGADVDGIEMLQSFDQRGGPKGLVTSDVDASQQNDECRARHGHTLAD